MDYQPTGVCSKLIRVDVQDDIVNEVEFIGGCSGNLQGISNLIKGMSVEEAISRVEGIKCGFKNTSCPDQLAKALKKATNRQ